jgi:hypothetical protein
MFFPFKLALVFLSFLGCANASHFRGGWITWKPISQTSTTVTMEFVSHWSWNRGSYFCDQSTINSNTLIGPSSSIACRQGCTIAGESIGNTQFYCTAFSASENWSYGEKKFTFTIPQVALYQASFTGCCWISLYDGTAPSWEIGISLNSIVRTDTKNINSSPITSMFPVVRIPINRSKNITIPVSDPDKDVIKCRWSAAVPGECTGICTPPAGVTIDATSCVVLFPATPTSGWYSLSVSIEDFSRKNPTTALSIVVVQFMINVVGVTSSCTIV